jgi:hypothetical protein
MPVSRRGFIFAGQTLLAAAAFPLKIFGASGPEFGSSNTPHLAFWNKATFQPLVSSSFGVRSGSLTTAWLTLLSVEDMNPKTSAQGASAVFKPNSLKSRPAVVDTFALHFQGTGEALPQGTYELEHHTLGNFSLFIVPAGVATYAAVISHILNAPTVTGPRPVKSKPQAGAAAEL